MRALFADLPEALENTVEIARRCAYRPLQRQPILPPFLTGGEASTALGETEAAELRRQSEAGLKERIAQYGVAPGFDAAAYAERLAFELDVITGMNYQGYFLIVADFIKWAKAEGIPVGPGRGSGAGSLVAYALTITDLDPIRFGLLFERFLNPERVSMPDFDIDFCQDRRDEVIAYVRERYGAHRVAHIITFGKLQARAVLRDVGRVLQMPYGQVDRLCKLVPMNPANPVTLPQAIAAEPRLQEARDAEPIVAKLLDIGQRLEGLYRHASTHAAGVVIADRPLIDLVPLYRDARAQLPATQFSMKWAEAAGLVKFDFLGLKTLTVIETARKLIARRGIDIDPGKLPLDDPATFELLQKGDTVGVFQLEGQGMRDALRKLKPDRFEDIIAIVALYRPGPMDNIDSYVNRKHGREGIESLHDTIAPILERNLWRHHLPRAGDADRPGALRLLARRGGSSPPRHGQEDQEGDGGAENPLRRRRGRQWRRARPRRIYLRAGGEVRRLRLQQIARGGLRADRLSDRLSEGQLPDRVHRRVDDARYGQCRQAERLRARSAASRHAHRAALGEPLRGRLRPERRRHPLFACRAEECRPPRGRAYLRRARGQGTVPRPSRFRPAHRSACRQQARA